MSTPFNHALLQLVKNKKTNLEITGVQPTVCGFCARFVDFVQSSEGLENEGYFGSIQVIVITSKPSGTVSPKLIVFLWAEKRLDKHRYYTCTGHELKPNSSANMTANLRVANAVKCKQKQRDGVDGQIRRPTRAIKRFFSNMNLSVFRVMGKRQNNKFWINVVLFRDPNDVWYCCMTLKWPTCHVGAISLLTSKKKH